ncbi:MAG: response regulator [Candidatus Gastranaerophilales bacterium]|nr:response regulator [Candidatus Gastranaerophilales bacterium]
MKNIVIADDSMFMRQCLKCILVKGGYNILGEAENGRIAVEMYEKFKPDLMTLDITMPELDGLGALKEIKEINNNAIVVMCSSMGQKYHMDESTKYGATDFIVKPFQSEDVLKVIESALNKTT